MQNSHRIAFIVLLAVQTATGEGSLLPQAAEETQLDDVEPPQWGFTTAGPSNGPSLPGVLNTLQAYIYSQLANRSATVACLVALVAFVIGSVMLVNGVKAFEMIIYVGVFALTNLLARQEIATVWSLDQSNKVVAIVGVEAGLALAYATWYGIDGVKIFVGGIIGGLACQKTLEIGVHIGMNFMASKSFQVVGYTLFVACFLRLFSSHGHIKALAYISPIFGGLFCSSALLFGLTQMAQAGYLGHSQVLHPVNGPWVDFLVMLWSFASDSKDVGIFVGSPFVCKIYGQTCSSDRLLGRLVWLLLVVIRLATYKKADAKTAPASNEAKVEAREAPIDPLYELLMSDEEVATV